MPKEATIRVKVVKDFGRIYNNFRKSEDWLIKRIDRKEEKGQFNIDRNWNQINETGRVWSF